MEHCDDNIKNPLQITNTVVNSFPDSQTPFSEDLNASQSGFETGQQQFDKNFAESRAQEAKRLSEDKKAIAKKKNIADRCNPSTNNGNSGNNRRSKFKQIFCPCPTCSGLNKVVDKIAGKNYFTIPFTNLKVPRFDHLIDKSPSFDENRRSGEKCGACGGSKKIADVTNDAAKYQQVNEKIQQNSEKILDKESKLGLGGTRTTFIQGSELLFVGLGFNSNKTYETVQGGSIAPTMKGGKIPQQNATPVNAVVGKQGSIAWPQQVGNYSIKCANKFSLLVGAAGITMATPGPLTISSGITKIIGPQITIGCANGPLIFEGDSVNISGKAISITPSGGELFVKGNINNTGNVTCQGHAHFEGMSFAKASCVGINKSTFPTKANPDVTQTQPATWSSSALATALLDLKTFTQSIPADSKTAAFRLLSPKEMQNMSDRVSSIAKLALPWELKPTGYILPGTQIKALGTFPCNWGGRAFGNMTGIVTALIPLNNFPHIHGLPEMMHKHEMTMPDMDYTSDSTEALRSKVLDGTHESGVPANPTKDTASRVAEVRRTTVEFAATAQVEATALIAKARRLMV